MIWWTQKKAGSSIQGNKAFITSNQSMLNAGNEHTYAFMLADFLTKTCLSLIYFLYEWLIHQIWKLKQQNQIKLLYMMEIIYLWKEECSSNKDWEQLSTTVAFEAPEEFLQRALRSHPWKQTASTYHHFNLCKATHSAQKTGYFRKPSKISQPYKNVLSSLNLFMSVPHLLVFSAPG